MAIRKVISRSILDGTVAAVDLNGTANSLSVNGILSAGAISTSIASTAVDVFVYDTRKDSDGGAWRKRTNQTSWYNETLNTATRGSRRDFPAVAVIVATVSSVTIYDGDSPDLPMWMVFTAGSQGMGGTVMLSSGNFYSLAAVNGVLVIGTNTNNDNYGSPIINFVSEKVVRMDPQTTEGGTWNGSIAERNQTKGYASYANSGGYLITNSIINDVAMTVLPNAPIDLATGIPIPTIAVATNAGINVIHNNGTVTSINSTDAVEYNYWRSVGFTKDYKLIINGTYLGVNNNIVHVVDIPYVNFSGSLVNSRITALNGRYYHSDSSIPNLRPAGGSGLSRTASTGINSLIVGTSQGLNFVAEAPETVSGISSAAMVAHVMPTYNTGWMHGNIKGAWLSDSNVETLGTELVTNGTFTSNVTGWTNYGTSITYSATNGGCAIVTPAASAWTGASQTITTVPGRRYIATATFISGTGYYSLSVNETGPTYAGKTSYSPALNPSNSTQKVEWTATGTSAYLTIDNLNTTNTNPLTVDNVTCKLADDDRSVNNAGLYPVGTITKSLVNTGNDLVAYSGFSTSNYLQQQYNSALDWGTGDFSVSLWFNVASQGGGFNLFTRNSLAGFSIWSAADLQYVAVYANSGGVTTAQGVYTNNTWNLLNVVRRNGVLFVFINGREVYSVAFAGSISASGYPLIIGNGSHSYSAALLRTSSTAPTDDQIYKMYNDEKYLFIAGAKGCLYGSSATITDVAYDDSTDLLHVGTSAGRSVFDGLRRVDNTTTAVTTAISASNGLVVEQ